MEYFNIKKVVLFATALLCSVTTNAYDFEVDGIYYNIVSASDLTVEVTNGDNEYTGEVIIPSTITYKSKTLNVISIKEYTFEECTRLTSVTIGNNVVSIGNRAFFKCSNLARIKMPEGITSIGSAAFKYCKSLASIEIPKCITNIGAGVFHGCSSLTSIEIPKGVTSIGENAFYECSGLQFIYNNSSLDITAGSFEYGYLAYYARAVIKPSDDAQGDFVFRTTDGTHSLIAYIGNNQVVSLPENYKGECYTIGTRVFYKYNHLTNIRIPNSITSIGDCAFYGCSHLTSIEIPNSVTSIGCGAFYNCSNLTSIEIPNSVTSIGSDTFYGCSNLTSITIPNSVTKIWGYAFYGCTALKDLCIEDGAETLSVGYNHSLYEGHSSLFCDCPLENIYLGRNLEDMDKFDSIGNSIPPSCFSGRNCLTSITIGNNVTRLGEYLFSGCSGLNKVTIGNSVTSIEDYVFNGCTKLTSIYLSGETPPSVGDGNFTEGQYVNVTLYVPTGTLEAYRNADTWKKFWDIQEFEVTGINDTNASSIAIEATTKGISLSNAYNANIDIYTVNGVLVKRIENYTGGEIVLSKGIYLVCVNGNTIKIKL